MLLPLGLAPVAAAAGVPDTIGWVEGESIEKLWWISEHHYWATVDAAQELPGASRLERARAVFPEHDIATWREVYRDSGRELTVRDGELVDCEPLEYIYPHYERALDLRRLVELSQAIAHVRIVGEPVQGFTPGGAGSLVDVEVISILKDDSEAGIPLDGFYLHHQYARMMIDGEPVCLGKEITNGEYYLFLKHVADGRLELRVNSLMASSLVALDGAFYGSLLDHRTDSAQLARALAVFVRGANP